MGYKCSNNYSNGGIAADGDDYGNNNYSYTVLGSAFDFWPHSESLMNQKKEI